MAKERRKVYIVSDSPVVAAGLRTIIDQEPDLKVAAASGDGKDILTKVAVAKLRESVLLLFLEPLHAINFAKRVKQQFPTFRTIVISANHEELFAERIFRAGASGVMNLNESAENILTAIRQVSAGETYVDSSIVKFMARNLGTGRTAFEPVAKSVTHLTRREFQVFRLTGKGVSTKQISVDMGVAVKTVDSFRARIKKKMGLKSYRDVFRTAVLWETRPRSSRRPKKAQ